MDTCSATANAAILEVKLTDLRESPVVQVLPAFFDFEKSAEVNSRVNKTAIVQKPANDADF